MEDVLIAIGVILYMLFLVVIFLTEEIVGNKMTKENRKIWKNHLKGKY